MEKHQAFKKIEQTCLKMIKEAGLSYDDFQQVISRTRKMAGLKKPKRGKRLPRLLSEPELKAFFAVCRMDPDPKWELFFRLLLATACRIEEFCHIRQRDIDFGKLRIYIEAGKGDVDGYVPFPGDLALAIRQQCQNGEIYLFESSPAKAYSPRRIQQKMDALAMQAGIMDEQGKSLMHPHLFRHQTTTFLLESGMALQDVMKITRHTDPKSLMVYNHIALNIPHQRYQQIMAGAA